MATAGRGHDEENLEEGSTTVSRGRNVSLLVRFQSGNNICLYKLSGLIKTSGAPEARGRGVLACS